MFALKGEDTREGCSSGKRFPATLSKRRERRRTCRLLEKKDPYSDTEGPGGSRKKKVPGIVKRRGVHPRVGGGGNPGKQTRREKKPWPFKKKRNRSKKKRRPHAQKNRLLERKGFCAQQKKRPWVKGGIKDAWEEAWGCTKKKGGNKSGGKLKRGTGKIVWRLEEKTPAGPEGGTRRCW